MGARSCALAGKCVPCRFEFCPWLLRVTVGTVELIMIGVWVSDFMACVAGMVAKKKGESETGAEFGSPRKGADWVSSVLRVGALCTEML
jgi:hypothetical protein